MALLTGGSIDAELQQRGAYTLLEATRIMQRVVSDPMEAAWVGVHLWAQAVHEAQSVEPQKIHRAMLNQRLPAGQPYGYRVHGPTDPTRGLRFDSQKVLLDPYGRGVAVPDRRSSD